MVQSTKVTDRLHPKWNAELKKRIETYVGYKPEQLALQAERVEGVDFQFFIEQIALLQKAKIKLPTFFEKRCLLTKKTYEQCTSERVAAFKASLFSAGRVLDLTAGLGVDSMAFSRQGATVVAVEPNAEVNHLYAHNRSLLGLHGVERFACSALDFLPEAKGFDLVYMDPDRRPHNARVAALADMEPPVAALLPHLLKHNRQVALKLSPLFDNHEAVKCLPALQQLITIAENNEVKELLAIMQANPSAPVKHTAVNLQPHGVDTYNGEMDWQDLPTGIGGYFYEPCHALIKSRLWQHHAARLGMKATSPGCPYLFADELLPGFMGRKFEVQAVWPYKPEIIKRQLATMNIAQANISRRQFSDSPELIRKKLGIADGGDTYLFFTAMHRHVCICCRKAE